MLNSILKGVFFLALDIIEEIGNLVANERDVHSSRERWSLAATRDASHIRQRVSEFYGREVPICSSGEGGKGTRVHQRHRYRRKALLCSRGIRTCVYLRTHRTEPEDVCAHTSATNIQHTNLS